ncbi:MAG: DUF2155 domain-containing protein [Candidatus Liberibacter europaeus]|uniref:DUF2155 domain-containing protein n=1 Tax=Candidatus Liberibacter europaeus TaxID=744859 RepID=A0A2T4VXJ5_9HYPH|nr:DUF2155 domain-containing protein [Candidatus Liberibacter europaeus]PTL86490.1 MAG: DUF2155 domain-containing protein [Candidatus Liberibacter europaeus]
MRYKVLLLTLFFLVESSTIVQSARLENRIAEFAAMDKITSRVLKFDVEINKSVQFRSLKIVPRVCYSRDGHESPRVDSFVEISEMSTKEVASSIFSGWMFADSPAMNAVDHPIYDVWLIKCKNPIDNSYRNNDKSVYNDKNNTADNSNIPPQISDNKSDKSVT